MNYTDCHTSECGADSNYAMEGKHRTYDFARIARP